MKRLLYSKLLEWKNDSFKKPVLLKGARQVGKSYLIKKFGQEFNNFVEINFDSHKNLKHIFDKNLDTSRILRDIKIALKVNIEAQKTLLFFDEIQECPEAIKALRYFYENIPALHVIAAGSLVDFALEKTGLPVGRITTLYLYPLSFVEYLFANDEQKLVENLFSHSYKSEISIVLHDKLMSYFGEYMAVGGMPEAIKLWMAKKELTPVINVHHGLIETYKQDFEKYATMFQQKYVELIYSSLAKFVGKKLIYSSISTDIKARELGPALDLLCKAQVVHKITHSSSGELPLASGSNPKFFKVIFQDVALMQAMLFFDQSAWITNISQAVTNFGAVTEAFVGQEILAYGNATRKQELYYWAREKRGAKAEIDYVTNCNGTIVPIEVKTGNSKKLKSLNIFLKEKKHVKYGVHFSNLNSCISNTIHRYPLYAVASALLSGNLGK